MKVNEHRGVYADGIDTVGIDCEFILITEKDLQTVFQCGECDEIHDDREAAEKCCAEENEASD